ncbi:hypothetical protein LTR67_006912 [Exophiala xenobiotica]
MAINNAATTEPKNNAFSYSSPEPTQSETSDRVAAPSAFSGEGVHDDSSNADMQLHQLAASPTEVSYIDWDDDDGQRGPSRLARVKKSFADLRAAERFISDVSSAKKTATVRQNQDVVAVKCSTVDDNISVPTTDECWQQASKEKCAANPTSFRDRPLPDIPVPVPVPHQPTPQAQDIAVDAPSVSTLKKKSGKSTVLAIPNSWQTKNEQLRRRCAVAGITNDDPSCE